MWSSNIALSASLLFSVTFAQRLPVVDLGYELHQAISFNATGQTYNFSNIRYAQPPVGNLRWAPPHAPMGRNTTVQNGSVGSICPQASPAWYFIGAQFLQAIVAGTASSFNLKQAEQQLQAYLASGAASAPPDPRTTEDCLFLDVITPKAVFNNAHNRYKRGAPYGGAGGAPVLVWIYGGGYTGGNKQSQGNPSGLIKASQKAGGQGIIFVAMNYRLGALGFMAGPSLQAAGGVSNAAFYDQRLAIEWVAKNIHLFGGDPKKITIMGESAGGGSVQHQITAYGGERGVSFQRAIAQSPAFLPNYSPVVQENTTQAFLKLLNVSTIAEARQLDSASVIRANALQIAYAPYGQYYYGPAADGVFVPELPGLLLNAGAFAHNVSVMVGHNTNEAPFFTRPDLLSNTDLAAFIKTTYIGATQSTVDYVLNTLYPAVYDGTYPWRSPLERTFNLVSDSSFVCNTNYLNKAFNNQTYAYEFQVPPAFHGFDVPYTFYNGQGTNLSTGLIAPVAEGMQAYITNFVQSGNPNGPGVPPFPMQGKNASMNGLNVTGFTPQIDPTVNARCTWWQKAQYY